MYPDMGVTYTILFFWLALSIQHIFCLSEFHGILTEEELMTYTKQTSVKEYDIISPRIHNAPSVRKRSTDSTDHNEAHKVTFTAFDEEHHLTLTKNHWLLIPGLEVEYVQPDGSIRKEPVQSRDCHFFATSISHQGSTGALSTCGGVRGALSVKDEMLYIEPLKGSHTKRMKRSMGDDIQPHIIYKRSDSDDELFCPVGQSAAANSASSGDSGGSNGNVTTYTGPYLGAKFMEIYYVVDGLVYDEHGNDTETYAMTVLNIMSRRFADPSLDISMRISVVRFLISMTTTLTANDTTGSPSSMTTSTDTDATLTNFCDWQASQSVDDDTNQNDWDLAILLTGHDLQRGGSSSSVGLAYVGTTCTLNAKCGINENIGFASGLVMAHETGHLLSLSHDGDPDYESCPTGTNIMSPSLSFSSGAFEWSSCSSEHMKIFLSQSSSQCLDDVPSFTLSPIDEYPGEIYDRDQQCQFAMKNPDALGCSSESCTVLFCMLPGESSCTSASQPAEGTSCGSGMWCINAECVNSTLNYTVPVDGGWSEYGNLSDCSRTCGTGVQIRSRTCTNPSPQWGGMPCIGDSHQYILCNEELCETSQDDFRNEQCSATNSIAVNGQLRTWTDYQEPSNCNLRCISTSLVDDRPGDFCDGTQCWYDDGNDVKSTNLCISGRCERFGCDGVLNSGLFYDDCLVCGGDGSSCNCTTGSVTTVMNIGEAVYVSIPIGSTSITADTYGSSQYIGLRVNEVFILGVNTTNMNYITSKGRYSIGNMVIDYDYEINIESHLQSLTEPSTEILDILVWAGSSSNPINFTYRYCTPAAIPPTPMNSMPATHSVSSTLMSTASDTPSFIMSSATSTSEASVSMSSMLATDSIVSSIPTGTLSDSSSFIMSSATPTSEASVSMTSMPATDSIVSSTPMGPASVSSLFTMSSATPTSEASVSMTSMPATDSIVSSTPMGPASDSSSFTMSSATPTSEASVSMTSMLATDSIVSSIPTGPASDSSSFIMSSATPTSEASVSMTSMPATDSIVSSTPMGPASVSSFTMSSATPALESSVFMTMSVPVVTDSSAPATSAPATPTPTISSSDVSTMSSVTPTTPTDPCTLSPCQNGGTCSSNDGDYQCTCPDTHEGTNCETEIDQCLSSPCQNGGTCSSSNGVYLCTCPDTHEGTNCETEKTTCDVVGCPSGETCTSESNVCECSGNTVRNNNGVCRAPQSAFTIQIVIVAFQTITDFQDVVNNQNSATSMEIRQSLTVILFTVYRRRYGTLFIGVIIRSFSLGSLEVEADLMFGEPENPTDTQQPPNNPMEIAEVFTNSLQSMDNTSTTGDFVVDSTRTTVTDTDECSNSTFNDCSQYADCTNTVGSFTCACLDGFQDTSPTEDLGRQCEDFNECSNPKICPEFATCMNSPGSFSCTCLPGFTGDGTSCAPVDESGVLSDAELAGLVIGGVVIVFLVFIIIVTCFILIRRMMLRRTKSGKSINRLGPLNGGRGAGPFINGYYGDGYPLADYPSEMELGPINKPGYHNGAYYREPNEREGFSRPYMTAGENEQMPHF